MPRRPRLQVRGEAPPSLPNFLDKIGKEPIITVELDPPKGVNCQKVIKWSKILAEEGADAISLADNPLAIIRMSPFVVGHLVQKESGLPALVHCSCRDRNLLGQQSELMGAAALGIASIFAVTGDPASLGGVLGASSVFDTNSFGLIEMIAKLNQGLNITENPISGKANFIIGAALNPNSTRLEPQIKRLERKVALGAQYIQTQPVFDAKRIRDVYEKAAHVNVPIFMGVMPLVSFRNAEFLHNEVPGMSIPEPIRERMKIAEPDRGIEEGIVIAKEFIDITLDAGAPGIYIIPQFGKYEIAAQLVRYIRAKR
jgi:homocysteine S-methyltransferase